MERINSHSYYFDCEQTERPELPTIVYLFNHKKNTVLLAVHDCEFMCWDDTQKPRI